MKKYIERYIYAVTKRLPESQRDEVKKDLESNIYDMLSESPTDEEIDKLLHELGNPRVIAQNYLGEQKFIIDPILYTDFKTTLKIVLIIFGSISIFFNAVDALLNIGDVSFWIAFGNVTEKIFNGLCSTLTFWFTLITLIFWGLSQSKAKDEFLNKWKLKDLPELVKPEKVTIGRVQTMVGFVFSTIFTIMGIIFLMAYIDKIGIYENGILTIQFFEQSVVNPFIPVFIISYILSVVVYILKLKNQRYTLSMVVVYSISEIISMVAFLVMINSANLILPQALNYWSVTYGSTVAELSDKISSGIRVFTVVVIILNVLNVGGYWRKLYKSSKK